MLETFNFPYVKSRLNPVRRKTVQVRVGNSFIGGNSPILVQSMTTTKPKEIDRTVKETLALAEAGCGLVRITVPTFADACALKDVISKIRGEGCTVPVSADIHFQPKAAFEALKWVEKVRINPGNFVDSGIATIANQTEKRFDEGREKVFEAFTPFIREAKNLGRAIRIGVNHGSLSARMLYRYGDTVEGMVESAMEYLAVCEAEKFDQVVVSLKSSTPRVAIAAYRMLAARLEKEHFKAYPFHVGVTEAGVGEDGRLKSSVGIGALLLDGLADTIRVSLTEDPVAEIPVARELIQVCSLPKEPLHFNVPELSKDPYHYARLESSPVSFAGVTLGGNEPVRVGEVAPAVSLTGETRAPEFAFGGLDAKGIVAFKDSFDVEAFASGSKTVPEGSLLAYVGENMVFGTRALVSAMQKLNQKHPLLLYKKIGDSYTDKLVVASEFGSLLSEGFGDAVVIDNPLHEKEAVLLAFDLLQAAGTRRSKTEFISCPGCGRTLYDIRAVLGQIQARLGHLQNISIAVMGCIVNGVGEMADADFGYVGGGRGFINLFEGKNCVKKNVPEREALDELVELIKSRGRYIEEKV